MRGIPRLSQPAGDEARRQRVNATVRKLGNSTKRRQKALRQVSSWPQPWNHRIYLHVCRRGASQIAIPEIWRGSVVIDEDNSASRLPLANRPPPRQPGARTRERQRVRNDGSSGARQLAGAAFASFELTWKVACFDPTSILYCQALLVVVAAVHQLRYKHGTGMDYHRGAGRRHGTRQ